MSSTDKFLYSAPPKWAVVTAEEQENRVRFTGSINESSQRGPQLMGRLEDIREQGEDFSVDEITDADLDLVMIELPGIIWSGNIRGTVYELMCRHEKFWDLVEIRFHETENNEARFWEYYATLVLYVFANNPAQLISSNSD